MLTHKGTAGLRTERLELRRLATEDVPAAFCIWATDEKAAKFLSWEPYTEMEKLYEYINDCVKNYESNEYDHWGIVFEGTLVGTIRFHAVSNKSWRCELGYCIGSRWWNRGIVTEAVRSVLQYAFTEIGMNKVSALHDVENPASGRVMEKCGFIGEGLLRKHSRRKDGTFGDMRIHGIHNEEWKEKQRKEAGV